MRRHKVELTERELRIILAALDLEAAATPRYGRRAEVEKLERRLLRVGTAAER